MAIIELVYVRNVLTYFGAKCKRKREFKLQVVPFDVDFNYIDNAFSPHGFFIDGNFVEEKTITR